MDLLVDYSENPAVHVLSFLVGCDLTRDLSNPTQTHWGRGHSTRNIIVKAPNSSSLKYPPPHLPPPFIVTHLSPYPNGVVT